jgi:toxin ParE1/3/4
VALNVVITASAREDLVDIWAWIAGDSPDSADRVLDRVYEVVQQLAELPNMGRARDELLEGLRSFVVGSYVVFYMVSTDSLVLLRVLHGRRDTASMF